MKEIPKGNRLHVAIFGRKNAGKSSVMNALSGRTVAEVSDIPGTTEKAQFLQLELEPVGPVVLIDTVGFEENDHTEIGEIHARKLKEVMDQTDLALLLFMDTNEEYSMERRWYRELAARHIPVLGVINRIDDRYVDTQPIKVQFDDIPLVKISAKNRVNLNRLRESIRRCTPLEYERSTIVGDLIEPNDMVLLVTPSSLKAPRYRLPVTHAQLVRDIMDHQACAVSLTEVELGAFLQRMNRQPDLIVTESEIFEEVSRLLPGDVPITTVSILMARFKGDLDLFIQGAHAIGSLRPGDKVLIAEACPNHERNGDISREKLPEWLQEKAGGELEFTVRTGGDFPADVSGYNLILHCSSCMFNRKQIMARLTRSTEQRVPITTYGIALAHMNGLLDRIVPTVVY